MNTRPGIGYILHEEVAARYEVNPRPARRQPTGRTPAKQWGDLLVRQPNLADSWI
jgi:hypothetical protein